MSRRSWKPVTVVATLALACALLVASTSVAVSAQIGSRAEIGAAGVADVTGPCESRASRAPGPTSESTPTGPASDLFCIELLPTATVDGPRGLVELGRAATPFGTAVTADGSHVVRLTGWFEGLPEPSTPRHLGRGGRDRSPGRRPPSSRRS